MDTEGLIWVCVSVTIAVTITLKLVKKSMLYFEPMDASQVVETILLECGGHMFIRQELLMPASVSRFFKARL
jgi:hypothetical protein